MGNREKTDGQAAGAAGEKLHVGLSEKPMEKGEKNMGGMLDMLTEELEKVSPEAEDFVGEDGLLYCGFCKTARQRWLEISFRGRTQRRKVHMLCACRLAALEREQEKRLAAARRSYRKMLIKKCGMREEQLLRNAFSQFSADAAMLACVSWVEEWLLCPFQDQRGLLLTGGVGCGKTTLMACMLRALTERYQREQYIQEIAARRREPEAYPPVFYYTRTVDLISGIKAGFNNAQAADILKRCKEVPVLFLDDLGAEKPTEWVREQLYDLIDERYIARLPVHITTNLTIEGLVEVLGERTADRLREMCDPIYIDRPSFRRKDA